MAQLPPAVEQVLRVHASFIHTVVNALRDRSQLPDLMKQLDAAEQAGWARLVGALRQVIDGRRDPSIRLGLDERTASCSTPSCAASTIPRRCRRSTPSRTAAAPRRGSPR